MVIEFVSTDAEAAIAPAMISPWVSRLSTRASISPLAELVEIHDAADQHDDGREVEEDDAPRQAGKERVTEDAADDREGMDQKATWFGQAFQFIEISVGNLLGQVSPFRAYTSVFPHR